MNDLSKMLFLLYFVSNQAPDGADQVEAAYHCYEFALRHEDEFLQIKRAHEIVKKIKRKYPILKTQHLLHLHGLVDDKLFQLIEHPKELIYALYSHENILKPQKTDINKVAEEIANLQELDFEGIQNQMLEKWLSLSDNNPSGDLDETFYEDLNTSSLSEEILVNDGSVTRSYIIIIIF